MKFTINEAIDLIDKIVDSNYTLKKENVSSQKIAIELSGQHGIGKSQSIEEYAKSKGYAFFKKELAQITDETSLFGFPRQTYVVEKIFQLKDKNGNIIRDDENKPKTKTQRKNIHISELQSYKDNGWTQISKDSELTYSTPEMVSILDKTPKSILLLDEFNRALPLVQAATMNLILDGKYGNWSLPPGCTIILSNNPNDGRYNVSDVDDAGMDRKFTITLKSDINSWVLWASKNGIKEECINFLYKSPEVRDKDDSPSYRRWTQFFNAIKNVDLSKGQNLDYVYKIGAISIGEHNINVFKAFVDNKLDILPSISDLFNPKENIDVQIGKLKQAIYYTNDKGQFVLRNDITGLLGLRLKGYLRSNNILKPQVDRLESILSQKIIPKDSLIDILTDFTKPDHPNKNQITNVLQIPEVKKVLASIGLLNI